jgi:tyrosyl-tRNA synthetase
MAEVTVPADQLDAGRIWVAKLLQLIGFAVSTSDGRRSVQGGAVTIDEQKITDPNAQVEVKDGMVVQVGKRRVAKLKIG